MLLMNLFGLIISIAVLVWGADKFVDNSALVAKKFGLSELTIGLTIVALGTSAPEIFVGISSVLSKTEELALGTVIGSNISNIALIFGVSCIGLTAKPIRTSSVQFIAFALSAIVLGIALNDLRISHSESILLLLVFFIFIFITYKFRSNGLATEDDIPLADDGLFKIALFLLIGLLCLILGSRYAVLHAKEIALILNVSELIIGLTIIAIGTSLPELAATISAEIVAASSGKLVPIAIIVRPIISSDTFRMRAISFACKTAYRDPSIRHNNPINKKRAILNKPSSANGISSSVANPLDLNLYVINIKIKKTNKRRILSECEILRSFNAIPKTIAERANAIN